MYTITWIEIHDWYSEVVADRQTAIEWARALERRNSCRCVRVERKGVKVPHKRGSA
jgi:hypothetical protein